MIFLMLGNSGIGKLTFQAYLLYCLIQGRDFLSLPLKPEVIIRHISGKQPTFEVYLMRSGNVYTTTDLSVSAENKARGKILRLYEPETDERPPPTTENVLTLSTLSLYPRRVKEVKKQSAISLYMPVWTKPELVALGRHYHRRLADSVVKYDDESVTKRFERYGGIIRFVLPSSKVKEAETFVSRNGTFSSTSNQLVLINDQIRERVHITDDVSVFLVHLFVLDNIFTDIGYKFPSSQVRDE
jgi:hypothetical protein